MTPGESLEIDRDVDPVSARQLGGGGIVNSTDVVKSIDRRQQTMPHRAVGCPAIGVTVNAEAITIVRIEQARREIHRRMVVEIGREIANSQAVGARLGGMGDRSRAYPAEMFGRVAFRPRSMTARMIFER